MGKTRVFRGGLPTGPDVRRLMEAIPVALLVPGFVIAYEAVGKVIGEAWPSNRFKTVLGPYLRALARDHNIDTEPVPNEGRRVLAPSEKVGVVGARVRKSARAIGKTMRFDARIEIEKLPTEEHARAEHQRTLLRRMAADAAQTTRELAGPKPAAQLPRGGPPEKRN